MKMNSIQFYEPLNIKYEETEIKDPKEGEVQVKIMAALTCGTDVKTYKRGHPVLIKKIPSGFGHEFAGIITKIGKNTAGFNIGDRVAAANSAPCGKCFFCRRGEYNLCENLEFLNGAYAEYINIPKSIVKRNLLHMPEDLSFERAAFAEPLANVVHGIEKTGIKEGQTVGVVGLGPIGLMFCRLSKMKGARVIAAGRNPLKLEAAKDFGLADEVVDLKKYKNPEKIFIDFSDEKKGLDVAVECVGLPEIWERMFTFVRKGGTVHLFGGCKEGTSISIDTKRLHYDEIKVLSIFHHTPLYFREAFRLIYEEKLPVEKLITDTYPLERTEEALIKHMNGKALKVLIKP
ncbi:MAG: alcohol dehydrogenase catalytic domain-containing protein [Candidatus Gastranaerophilales bacterium]|nr:alcohol dehydrogenase catalytic domain-containing protein [Candidatus Gastranaerophilales bacterium]